MADERLGPRRSRRPELPQHILTGLLAEEPLAVVRHHHLDPPGRSLPGRDPLVAGDLLLVAVGLGQPDRLGVGPDEHWAADPARGHQGGRPFTPA
jgi:hypothetical protein